MDQKMNLEVPAKWDSPTIYIVDLQCRFYNRLRNAN